MQLGGFFPCLFAALRDAASKLTAAGLCSISRTQAMLASFRPDPCSHPPEARLLPANRPVTLQHSRGKQSGDSGRRHGYGMESLLTEEDRERPGGPILHRESSSRDIQVCHHRVLEMTSSEIHS